jgi:branched-chain amino acid transport system substrate-binding protein
VIEKGAEPVQFQEALGADADGVMVGGYWDPSFPYKGAAELRDRFEQETGKTSSQHIADSYAAARILIDAISRAGSTDKEKVNAAIARTDGEYVVGPVKFAADHTSKLPIVELQWQGKKTPIVGPTKKDATGALQTLGG